MYNIQTAADAERVRVDTQVAMAEAFEKVDFIVAATNPGPAFAAHATTSNPKRTCSTFVKSSQLAKWAAHGRVVRRAHGPGHLPTSKILNEAARRYPDMVSMGALTIISNIYGNPAVSIPAGTVDGLPIGMQVLGKHHQDALLFDVALTVDT